VCASGGSYEKAHHAFRGGRGPSMGERAGRPAWLRPQDHYGSHTDASHQTPRTNPGVSLRIPALRHGEECELRGLENITRVAPQIVSCAVLYGAGFKHLYFRGGRLGETLFVLKAGYTWEI
jgi:hypothetical protein